MQTKITLTNREVEFLILYAIGFTAPQIAKLWFVDKTTVKTHMQNIRKKMRVTGMPSAVVLAHQNRIINLDELTIIQITRES